MTSSVLPGKNGLSTEDDIFLIFDRSNIGNFTYIITQIQLLQSDFYSPHQLDCGIFINHLRKEIKQSFSERLHRFFTQESQFNKFINCLICLSTSLN